MSIKIIEYNGISGYARVMYDDVKEADKYHTEVAYDGKDVKALLEYLFELEQEIERLNNIINELEKYLNEQVDYMTHHSIERMVAFDCCRHKLQELKGNNNGVWVNNLLEVIKENNIEFGSDLE